jgi:hypothetical protein
MTVLAVGLDTTADRLALAQGRARIGSTVVEQGMQQVVDRHRREKGT